MEKYACKCNHNGNGKGKIGKERTTTNAGKQKVCCEYMQRQKNGERAAINKRALSCFPIEKLITMMVE